MGERNDSEQNKTAKPAPHSDAPTGREEKSIGAGSEALPHSDDHDQEHRSGYGGKGGEPDTSSDKR